MKTESKNSVNYDLDTAAKGVVGIILNDREKGVALFGKQMVLVAEEAQRREHERWERFATAIESYTENFDDFCDCENKHTHEKECQTMRMRLDLSKARGDAQ